MKNFILPIVAIIALCSCTTADACFRRQARVQARRAVRQAAVQRVVAETEAVIRRQPVRAVLRAVVGE